MPSVSALRTGLVFAALVGDVAGHGNMNMPIPRNNIGRVPISADKDPSNLGDAMQWFSQGCYIGCPKCEPDLGTGLPFVPLPKSCDGLLLNATLPDEARTMNIAGLKQEVYQVLELS